ncbi:MAG TPA: alpha/beta hydrolase [Bacillota bacterium]|nr:alpha/beta hydrolase [Bacillota bacterium]HOL51131.1 alpha/beta hydrolase [Bacillota bacterium]
MHVQTVEYKRVDGCSICADVYGSSIPSSPAVVYIHGGGLIWGSRKRVVPEQISAFVGQGYTVISIDHRLAPQTKLPSIVEDVCDALSWVLDDCPRFFGIDPDRVAVFGRSAGAYLALLSGTLARKPKAVVSYFGFGDLLTDWGNKPSGYHLSMPEVSKKRAYECIGSNVISGSGEERLPFYIYCRQQGIWMREVVGLNRDDRVLKEYSPMHNVRSDYPPTLLMHGEEDKDVDCTESVKMANALTHAGVKNELITLPGLGHSFDRQMGDARVRESLESMLAFLRDNL